MESGESTDFLQFTWIIPEFLNKELKTNHKAAWN